jgi:hypothetical protein
LNPAKPKPWKLVEIAGKKVIRGGNNLANGKVSAAGKKAGPEASEAEGICESMVNLKSECRNPREIRMPKTEIGSLHQAFLVHGCGFFRRALKAAVNAPHSKRFAQFATASSREAFGVRWL